MYEFTRYMQLAGRIRRARDTVAEVDAALVELGREDFSLKLLNVTCELSEVHAQIMEPLRQPPAPARRFEGDDPQEQLPF